MTDSRHIENSNAQHASDILWDNCSEGSLSSFAKQARVRRFRRQLLAAGSLVASACVLVAVIASFPSSKFQRVETPLPFYGGLSCSETLMEMEPYLVGSIGEALRPRIKGHLQDCPSCKFKFEQRAEELGVELAYEGRVRDFGRGALVLASF